MRVGASSARASGRDQLQNSGKLPNVITNQILLRQVNVQKILAKFPTDIRESINTAFQLSYQENEQFKREVNMLSVENSALKAELRGKQSEVLGLFKLSSKLKQQVKDLEDTSYDLKDKLEFRTKFTNANKNNYQENPTVNKMLMECLETLQQYKSGSRMGDRTLTKISPNIGDSRGINSAPVLGAHRNTQAVSSSGSAIRLPPTLTSLSPMSTGGFITNNTPIDTAVVSADRQKNAMLEDKVHELSLALKKLKQDNQELQNELNQKRERKSSIIDTSHNTVNSRPNSPARKGGHNSDPPSVTPASQSIEPPLEMFIAKKRLFDAYDQRLQVPLLFKFIILLPPHTICII